ncbi:hypothetical protein FACS189481_2610 [Clostridia bacterium]|nr:hypothetical protein FACS189481_2610 [Clostridia bacterium]
MTKVRMATRNEVIGRYVVKYSRASKKSKGEILDSICLTTGISRSHLIHVFTQNRLEPKQQKRRGGCKRKYGPEVVTTLIKLWAYMDFASGKRLKAGMQDLIEALVQFGEVNCSNEILAKLHQMSAATMDRLLKHEKEKMQFRGISTTKPGTLLKRDIPMRLGTQWDDAKVGFVEIDLVAHCGETTAGEYVNTLDVTDICTGWTETAAVINKAQKHVFKALLDIRERLPFPLLGIDSDNGSEFINHELYRYCSQEQIYHITF